MTYSTSDRLTLKVLAVNYANEYAKQLYPLYQEHFKNFVGQQIEKVDGSLLKKVANGLVFGEKSDIKVQGYHISFTKYRQNSRYTLSYVAKVCVSGSQGCSYHEAVIYLGDMNCGVLENLKFEAPSGRTNWTKDEVIQSRCIVERAKRELSGAESVIREFGQYDS